jgi:hypothetical protein
MHTVHQCDQCKRVFNGYGREYVEYEDMVFCTRTCALKWGAIPEEITYTDDEGTDETLEANLQYSITLVTNETYTVYTNDYAQGWKTFIGAKLGQKYFNYHRADVDKIEVKGIWYRVRI